MHAARIGGFRENADQFFLNGNRPSACGGRTHWRASQRAFLPTGHTHLPPANAISLSFTSTRKRCATVATAAASMRTARRLPSKPCAAWAAMPAWSQCWKTNGGETRLSNLVLLCRFHHRQVHEGGVTVQALDDSALRFTVKDGRSFDSLVPARHAADGLTRWVRPGHR